MGIQLAKFLDPRPSAEALARPYADSVNIPTEEIADRVAELPRKDEVISVIGPERYKGKALIALKRLGRTVVSASDPKFTRPQAPGRLWRPNAILEEWVQTKEPGKALDLACGTGRDAVFLASYGWDVTAVDVLPDALEMGQELAKRYLQLGSAPPGVTFQQLDLTRHDPGGTYDLITCFFYLNNALLEKLHAFLNPSGVVLIELFSDEDKAKHGRPKKSVNPAELGQILKKFDIETLQEGWHHGRHTVRVVASLK